MVTISTRPNAPAKTAFVADYRIIPWAHGLDGEVVEPNLEPVRFQIEEMLDIFSYQKISSPLKTFPRIDDL